MISGRGPMRSRGSSRNTEGRLNVFIRTRFSDWVFSVVCKYQSIGGKEVNVNIHYCDRKN